MDTTDSIRYGTIDPKLEKAPQEGAFQPDWTIPVKKIRDFFDRDDPADLPPAGVGEGAFDIPARDGHQMKARVWYPKQNGGTLPLALIILYHAGGFALGNHVTCTDDARRLVQELGCVCLAAEYRRGPDYPFPKAIEDGYDVLHWVTQNASTLGADLRTGFILHGASAGANVALVSALIARDENLSPPITGLAFATPLVFSPNAPPEKYAGSYKSWDQCQNAPGVPRKGMMALLDHYKPGYQSWKFNPVLHPKGLDGLPRTCFQIAGYDPYRDDALICERILEVDHGIRTMVDIYPGLPHLFWIAYSDQLLEETRKSRDDLVGGIKWVLQS